MLVHYSCIQNKSLMGCLTIQTSGQTMMIVGFVWHDRTYLVPRVARMVSPLLRGILGSSVQGVLKKV